MKIEILYKNYMVDFSEKENVTIDNLMFSNVTLELQNINKLQELLLSTIRELNLISCSSFVDTEGISDYEMIKADIPIMRKIYQINIEKTKDLQNKLMNNPSIPMKDIELLSPMSKLCTCVINCNLYDLLRLYETCIYTPELRTLREEVLQVLGEINNVEVVNIQPFILYSDTLIDIDDRNDLSYLINDGLPAVSFSEATDYDLDVRTPFLNDSIISSTMLTTIDEFKTILEADKKCNIRMEDLHKVIKCSELICNIFDLPSSLIESDYYSEIEEIILRWNEFTDNLLSFGDDVYRDALFGVLGCSGIAFKHSTTINNELEINEFKLYESTALKCIYDKRFEHYEHIHYMNNDESMKLIDLEEYRGCTGNCGCDGKCGDNCKCKEPEDKTGSDSLDNNEHQFNEILKLLTDDELNYCNNVLGEFGLTVYDVGITAIYNGDMLLPHYLMTHNSINPIALPVTIEELNNRIAKEIKDIVNSNKSVCDFNEDEVLDIGKLLTSDQFETVVTELLKYDLFPNDVQLSVESENGGTEIKENLVAVTEGGNVIRLPILLKDVLNFEDGE